MSEILELVDPTARTFETKALAAPLDPEAACRIALVDGTLNKGSHWGQGLLDAAEAVIGAANVNARFVRIDLNPLDNPPPDLWVKSALAGVDAMVVVGGDCVTCTTRGVRDAVWANAAGVRSVSFVTSAVSDIAAGVGASYGMPNLPIVTVTLSLFGKSRQDIAQAALPEAHALTRVLFQLDEVS